MTLRHRRSYTRAEREAMILQTFAIDIQHGNHRWLTPNQLAQRLEMARCGRFKAFLDGMVLDGRLICRETARPGRWPGYEYKLAPGTYQEPRARTIKLSIRGQQQEMVFE